MAGTKSNRQRKASFSLFSMFKRGTSTNSNTSSNNNINNRKVISDPTYWDEAPRVRRVYPSDEDRRLLNWVAKPGIDRMATDFIAKFHEARLSESQTMAIQNN